MPSRRRLQQYAIAISILSVFYNTAEGVVSIVFGAESSSRALVFYGLQSAVEVISALLVTWRFCDIAKPGDESEHESKPSPKIIRIERIATITIGALLIALALAALATSIAALATHDQPSTALPSLLIASTATVIMLLLYAAKRTLARALNSSALYGEALCALSCLELSLVLLVGSLIYRVWRGGWWVDSATAIVIGLLFGWEGVKMVRWGRDENFDGGCCADCRPKEENKKSCSECCSKVEPKDASPCSTPAGETGCCSKDKERGKDESGGRCCADRLGQPEDEDRRSCAGCCSKVEPKDTSPRPIPAGETSCCSKDKERGKGESDGRCCADRPGQPKEEDGGSCSGCCSKVEPKDASPCSIPAGETDCGSKDKERDKDESDGRCCADRLGQPEDEDRRSCAGCCSKVEPREVSPCLIPAGPETGCAKRGDRDAFDCPSLPTEPIPVPTEPEQKQKQNASTNCCGCTHQEQIVAGEQAC